MSRIAPSTPLRQRSPRVRDRDHMGCIAQCGCLVCGAIPVEVAHVRSGDSRWHKSQTGMQEKPHDHWTVPLCAKHHVKQHAMNEREFWAWYGIDVFRVCALLALHSGDLATMRRVVDEEGGR